MKQGFILYIVDHSIFICESIENLYGNTTKNQLSIAYAEAIDESEQVS